MTNQGDIQASIRSQTGTEYDYNGDWHALFDSAGIAAGEFNGRFILWLQDQTGSSDTDLDGLKQLYATQNGFYNWNSVNSVGVAEFIVTTDAGDEVITDAGDTVITG